VVCTRPVHSLLSRLRRDRTAPATGSWETAGELLATVGPVPWRRQGPTFLVLCANTMHKVADAIELAVSIPLLRVTDVVVEAIRAEGINRVGLLARHLRWSSPSTRTGWQRTASR